MLRNGDYATVNDVLGGFDFARASFSFLFGNGRDFSTDYICCSAPQLTQTAFFFAFFIRFIGISVMIACPQRSIAYSYDYHAG